MPPPERWTDTRRIPPPLAAPPPPPPPASGARPCPDADRRREWAAAYRADPPEPATAPPTAAHEPPAALDASPDTPEALSGAQGLILGRALLAGARVWLEDLAGTGLWTRGNEGVWVTRAQIEDHGPVREALLVHPAALAAAVDALTNTPPAADEASAQVTPAAGADAERDAERDAAANLATASRGLADGGLDELARREAETPTEPAVVRIADGVHWLGEVASDQPADRDTATDTPPADGETSAQVTPHAGVDTEPDTEPARPEPPVPPMDLSHAEREAFAAEVEGREPVRVLVTADGRCGCCAGQGEHPCGHECDSCDGAGRDPDSPVCTLPHGADCRCSAEPAPEPAGDGPRWDRERVEAIIAALGEMETPEDLEIYADPERMAGPDQLRSLLADRDHLAGEVADAAMTLWHLEPDGAESDAPLWQRIQAHAARWRADRDRLADGLEHARADRQDLWDTRDKRNHRWMEAAERLTEERDAARAELESVRMVLRSEAAQGVLELAGRVVDREEARRDGAADTLAALALHIQALASHSGGETHRRGLLRGAYAAEQWAAEVRSGEREVPTPAGDQDGDDDG